MVFWIGDPEEMIIFTLIMLKILNEQNCMGIKVNSTWNENMAKASFQTGLGEKSLQN